MQIDTHTWSWRAMGCAVEAVIVGGPQDLLGVAASSIAHLEQRWSRFLPDSDISRINHAAGSTVRVDPATMVLFHAMLDGWRSTAGVFDPTLLAPLVGLGYASSWHDPALATSLPLGALLRGDLNAVRLDDRRNTITVPRGMCLDAGGIGKGLAADLVVNQLLASGARGALVSIGGDICVRGEPSDDDGWFIGLADIDDHQAQVGQLVLTEGGVATSGTTRRRWRADDGSERHHLLDPTTGQPVEHRRQISAVTVIAGTAAWAEVWTKVAMVSGDSALALLDEHGLGAQIAYADRSTATNRSWASFVPDPEWVLV
jgi:FAD:protein FMN transferase